MTLRVYCRVRHKTNGRVWGPTRGPLGPTGLFRLGVSYAVLSLVPPRIPHSKNKQVLGPLDLIVGVHGCSANGSSSPASFSQPRSDTKALEEGALLTGLLLRNLNQGTGTIVPKPSHLPNIPSMVT